jgi:hypothetical protein
MKTYGWFGLLLLIVSEYCLYRKIEPILTWFYCFAWRVGLAALSVIIFSGIDRNTVFRIAEALS